MHVLTHVDLREEVMQAVVQGERVVFGDKLQQRSPLRLCLRRNTTFRPAKINKTDKTTRTPTPPRVDENMMNRTTKDKIKLHTQMLMRT